MKALSTTESEPEYHDGITVREVEAMFRGLKNVDEVFNEYLRQLAKQEGDDGTNQG